MLIVCPSCASTYSLAPAQISAKGRAVRCARCRETWLATFQNSVSEEGDEPLLLESELSDTPATPALAESTGPRPAFRARKKPGMRLPRPPATALAVLAGIVILAALATLRDTMVRLVPQTARLYAAVGLPVNLRGLDFTKVVTTMAIEDNQPLLIVQGETRNPGKNAVDIPGLRMILRGDDGRELYGWSVEAPRPTLEPGEVVPFRTRLASPPGDGRDVLVRFAEGPLHGTARP